MLFRKDLNVLVFEKSWNSENTDFGEIPGILSWDSPGWAHYPVHFAGDA